MWFKRCFLFFIPAVNLFLSGCGSNGVPQTEIDNGIIKAHLYLPDNENGYYRGTRFDWSGVIPSLEYNGHTFFGQWFVKYSPVSHDAIMGPVEEFGPLGYEVNDSTGSFVKIGVGLLSKPPEKFYQRFGYYDIKDPGRWTVKRKKDQVTFIHELTGNEYGYEYTKTVSLLPAKPVMEIRHSLRNTGTKPILTSVYDHNFFVIDSTITGPGLFVTFPFLLQVDTTLLRDLVTVNENTVSFRREIAEDEMINIGKLDGFTSDPGDYDIRIENRNSGAGVRITCDKPLSDLIFWASYRVLSPEPYIDISVDPGEEFTWKITYEFYTSDLK